MKCFLCDNTSEDNTHIILPIDNGAKVDLYLCEEHADTSLKKLKEAYKERINGLDELIAKAKSLGIELDINSLKKPTEKPQIIVAKPQDEPAPRQTATTVIKESNKAPENDDMIPTSMIDGKSMRSVGGNANGTQVSAYQSYDFGSLADKLPEDARMGKVKMTMVEGRGGQQIAIPQKRTDGLGETHINIIKAENDDRLQARFKKMATDSIQDKHANFAQSGYADTTRTCPFCQGRGLIKQNKTDVSCPKCIGSGIITIG